ncbi:ribokinase [Sporosarcina sp. Sa2YVA2]|uniref:Ribokinase n=1 Tax=Sporosarcina quadrami TaxID=2762234 RepID=A0ABR8U905_9BACL|nr:ribokinase [Sporosarcina quadrami]MBD7984521.1 ribokinase [Sporosarcina quadrami]
MVKITVIGSSSIDLVVKAHKRPSQGETILGESFKTVPGGKGANQAVAAARLGAEVYMVGCVGDDAFGESILENFKKNDVNTSYMEMIKNIESGTAHITLADGDNSIIVIKGANDYVTPNSIKKALDIIQESDIVLIQQEIPPETVKYVCEVCCQFGVPLILNPAPARKICKEIIEKASYITPNELETSILFEEIDLHAVLLAYPNKLFITEGEKGVRFHDGEREIVVPTFNVTAIDTTGAGDTFNAAFAVALAENKTYEESVRFANRAASLSVTKFGAQGGMPTRREVEDSM